MLTGTVLTMKGTLFWRPTIMKQRTLLYNIPFSSAPQSSPPTYSWLFCRYISSSINITSCDKDPLCNSNLEAFTVSEDPLVKFLTLKLKAYWTPLEAIHTTAWKCIWTSMRTATMMKSRWGFSCTSVDEFHIQLLSHFLQPLSVCVQRNFQVPSRFYHAVSPFF